MIIISFWTKFVSETRILASGAVTMINIFIWYYVLQAVVDQIENIFLVVLYAFGCAIGTMLATIYFRFQEQQQIKKQDSSLTN